MRTTLLFSKWRSPVALCMVALLGCCQCAGADIVDDAVDALMQKSHLPGLSLAIIQDGKIVKAEGYGYLTKGNSAPVTKDTLFQAGTLSQSVTTLGALSLVESGKLSLDSDVNNALKTWHIPENEFTKSSKVTLQELLGHTAGMSVPVFVGYTADAPVPTLLQILDGKKPANSKAVRVTKIPGRDWNYSSGGYVVAQQLISDVSGVPFPEFMSANVLRPLGMTSSSYEQPLSGARSDRAAVGHIQLNPLVDRWYVYPELAATGLWTTPTDIARFVIAIQQSYAGKPNPVISVSTAHTMLTHQKNDRGLGFWLSGTGVTAKFSNSGTSAGYFATLNFFSGSGQGAVVMINNDIDPQIIPTIMATIGYEYDWPDYQHIKNTLSLDERGNKVATLLQKIFEQGRAGDVNSDLFNSRLARQLTNRFSELHQQEMQAWGVFKSVTPLWWNNNLEAPEYNYLLQYEKKLLFVGCAFDKAGKITVFDF
jgi:CubicO group peptidase (beta-lactamase class C family)